MFLCQICGAQVGAGVPARKVVLLRRPHSHPERPRAAKKVYVSYKGKHYRWWYDDSGGAGTQIVREASACPECAAKYDGG